VDNVNACVGLTGALEAAWNKCFPKGLPFLTIVWHEGWLYRSGKQNHWRDLHQKLVSCHSETKLLVVIAEDLPKRPKNFRGDPLSVLLRVVAEHSTPSHDASGVPVGWASMSEINQFASRAVRWCPPKESHTSPLIRLCAVCAKLQDIPQEKQAQPANGKPPLPSVDEFFEFLDDPKVYRARKLHAAETNETDGKSSLRVLKWLESYVFVPHDIPLNVLIVENDPGKLAERLAKAKTWLDKLVLGSDGPVGFFSGAKVLLLRSESAFACLANQTHRNELSAEVWNGCGAIGNDQLPTEKIPWDNLDLIIQDIVLDKNGSKLAGLELVPHYFTVCPQALVFVLTGLDVESLVGSGDVNWRYVDVILSKDGTEALPYEYRRCFHERYGRMFWTDWYQSQDASKRKLLRGMFASLRRWQIEPDILWHGQSLPEMIDHAHRHISLLWQLTNNVVGTLLEHGGANREVMSFERRVALAVAVWMHDVGHRGDEFTAGPMGIRANHAGISERLLLRNPNAYQLGWLLADDLIPHAPCRESDDNGRQTRLNCRNSTACKEASNNLCLLREIGLLCRHHQSSAPLGPDSLAAMANRGKTPSVYSLVSFRINPPPSDGEFLANMTNEDCPVPSPYGTEVRSLLDFKTNNPNHTRSVAGLLRILDGLQLHRSRVGTRASRDSFEEFLETRFHWCSSERHRLETALRAATPGTHAFQRAMANLDSLYEYEILLTTQRIHFWRQAVVHDMNVRWRWEASGTPVMQISFTLSELALSELKKHRLKLPATDGTDKTIELFREMKATDLELPDEIKTHEHSDAIKKWLYNLEDEVVGDEHDSQYPNKTEGTAMGYREVLRKGVEFRVAFTGTDSRNFSKSVAIRIPPPRK
jgi:hypothetical protein